MHTPVCTIPSRSSVSATSQVGHTWRQCSYSLALLCGPLACALRLLLCMWTLRQSAGAASGVLHALSVAFSCCHMQLVVYAYTCVRDTFTVVDVSNQSSRAHLAAV